MPWLYSREEVWEMQFNSIPYIILFPLIALLCLIIPKRLRYIWLLIVSCAFYYMQSEGFFLLLVLCTAAVYAAALLIAAVESTAAKKMMVAAATALGVIVLYVFKYLDMTLALFGSGLRFNLILPLGISFYTFTAIGYVIDVYRGKIRPEKNPLKLLLFLSFFLSIVSGPINRAGDVIPQFSFEDKGIPSFDTAKRGMQKMLWGYFLKLAVAGRLSIIVENVYGDASAHSGAAIAFTALAYLFMLYCDFEGYSQIAIGSGYILGIRMKENFAQPFFSSDMGRLWRRWHVSLSSWFKDYLYIPLGGNRRGTARKYLNVFIVLVVSGIWHGANLTFLIWGAINGIFIIAGQMLMPVRDRVAEALKEKICKSDRSQRAFDRVRGFLKCVGVYILSAYTFIWFANKDVTSAYLAIKGIFTRFLPESMSEFTGLGLGTLNLALVMMMILFVLAGDRSAYKRKCDTPSLITGIPTFFRWAIYYALLIAILFSANLTGQEFIYSRM